MPRTKSWTILFYIVAKNADSSGDGLVMNQKASEVAEHLKAAAQAFPDMYIAFQVVFDPEEDGRQWIAELLNPDDNEPATHTGSFGADDSLAKDLLGFYAWALPRCPAEHVAVGFWGHSAGPAGLFEASKGIILPALPGRPDPPPRRTAPLPSLDLVEIRDTLRRARVGLRRSDRSNREMAEEILRAQPEESIVDPVSGRPLKVDLVLFQDCWMSTLETAFQLKDAAHFTIGSQSLVPFGRPSIFNNCEIPPLDAGAGVWPYERLFDHLAAYRSNEPRESLAPLVETLYDFYNQSLQIWPNPSLPFSLLDLDTIGPARDQPDAFDPADLDLIVDALQRLFGADKAARGAFLAKASLAVAGDIVCLNRRAFANPPTELAAGTIALIDVMILCRQLKAGGQLLQHELEAVARVCESRLVVLCRESIYHAAGAVPPNDDDYSFEVIRPDDPVDPERRSTLTQPLGFSGVGALYVPTETRQAKWNERDPYILFALERPFYLNLKLSTETTWATLALEN